MIDSSPPAGLRGWDIIIVVMFFAMVIAIGIYSMFRTNRGTVSGYFLAGRFMTWLPVGASIFASNIGSEHFIGLAGSGAAAGIGVGAFEVNAMIMIQLLGWVFAPVYIASGVCTLPEYIRRRFGGQRIRIWLSVLSLLLYIFTKISVNLFSGALFIRLALGWNLYLAILIILLISCLCTITGGLAAVIYTDTLCTTLMTVGSLIVTVMGFSEVGGYSSLKDKYMQAVSNDTLYSNSTCGRPRPDSFIMLRDPINSDIPWPGFIIGETIISIWYWCADQVIVQRVVAAKSLSHAQGGCLLAGYLKILPLFTLLMPGMISRVLSPDRVACSVPEKCMEICGSDVGCTNIAYPELVLKLMPTGLRGLMMAVMMAALMSDLTSIFNSASTLFTIDVYGLLRKKASVRELMIVGRMMVAVMTGISILWIPVIQNVQGGQLFMYIQAVTAYLSPPIASIYVVALFWKRATENGVFWGMMLGFVVGVIRMSLDFVFKEPRCGEPDNRPAITLHVHFMYFAIISFLITTIAIIILSYLTKPSPDSKLPRLTWWNRHDDYSANDHLETDRDNEIAMEHLQFPVSGESNSDLNEDKNDQSDNQDKNELASMSDVVPTDQQSYRNDSRPSPIKRFYNWFCGYEEGSEEAKKAAMEQQRRIATITSLKQDPRAKTFLNINFLFISIVCVFMLIYFSI